MLVLHLILIATVLSYDPSNRCHSKIHDKLFYLKPLQVVPYYKYEKMGKTYLFNFCAPFDVPDNYNCSAAYSFVLDESTGQCQAYSSDSKLYLYSTSLLTGFSSTGINITEYSNIPVQPNSPINKTTEFLIRCGDSDGLEISDIYVEDRAKLVIVGSSQHACPALEISRLWQALQNNAILFGIALFVVGIMELLFGRKLLQPTIFIAAYCLSFIILAALVSELIVKPNSSQLTIYFSLILVLMVSSMIAYAVMGASYLSIFCIGAWMGLIIAALVNSIFIKIFKVYSVWSMVGFAIVFCLLFGLLAYRYYDHIVILSTSLSGAYMIVRPFSWIFGGFPNEFILADKIRVGEISQLPSAFFGYFAAIIVLGSLGAIYQFLQLKRQQVAEVNGTIEIGTVQSKLEAGIDSIRNSINAIINKYRADDDKPEEGQYIEFQQLKRNSDKPLYPHLEQTNGKKEKRASSSSN